MNRITKNMVIIGLFLNTASNALGQDAIAQEQSKRPLSCPEHVALLKNTPIAKLHGSMNSSQTELYMSANYCFVFYKPDPENRFPSTKFHTVDKRFMLSHRQGSNIAGSYSKSYRWLRDNEQKLVFAHFFLQKLTHVALVTPRAVEDKRTDILIAVDISPSFHRFILMNYMESITTQEALHKLEMLQDNPPQAKDHPVLMALVDEVLKGEAVISDDTLYEITAKL